MKKVLLIIITFISITGFSQNFGSRIAEYNIRAYLVQELVPNELGKVIEFYTHPINASVDGEIVVSLFYIPSMNKNGIVLGLYDKIFGSGEVSYNSVDYTHLFFEEADRFVNLISATASQLSRMQGNNYKKKNLSFYFEDMLIMLTMENKGVAFDVRIFKDQFSVHWDSDEFRRFLKDWAKFRKKS